MAVSRSNGAAFWSGVCIGALWGAAVVWLYTPYSGRQLRTLAREQLGEARGVALDAYLQVKDQANALAGRVEYRYDPIAGRITSDSQ